MSNKMLIGLLVMVFIIIGAIALSEIGSPGSPKQELTQPPQVTASPTPPAAIAPAASAGNDLESILANIDDEEESITSADAHEDQLLTGEDEIINTYDINEEEL